MKPTALLLALSALVVSTFAQGELVLIPRSTYKLNIVNAAPNTDDGQNQPAAPPPTSQTSSLNLPPGQSFVSLSETASLTSTPFTISQRSDAANSQSPVPIPNQSANSETVTTQSLSTQNPSGPSFGQGGVGGGVSQSAAPTQTRGSASMGGQSSSMAFNVRTALTLSIRMKWLTDVCTGQWRGGQAVGRPIVRFRRSRRSRRSSNLRSPRYLSELLQYLPCYPLPLQSSFSLASRSYIGLDLARQIGPSKHIGRVEIHLLAFLLLAL